MKHGFKTHEWFCSKEDLKKAIFEYWRDYLRPYNGIWSFKDIEHFLNIYIHLYPTPSPQKHHLDAVATLVGLIK